MWLERLERINSVFSIISDLSSCHDLSSKKSRLFVSITNINVCICFHFFGDRKKYEGSNYRDGTSAIDTVDNAIAPGKVFKYIWQVPERTGPTEGDDDCVAWAYYSDSASVRDFYTGLVGPLVVCKKVYLFIYLFIHSFIYLFTYLFFYSFIYLFIYLFIY